MDQISSHSSYNLSQLYQRSSQSASRPTANTSIPTQESALANNSDFASMFSDDSLLKLQSNLEAIANMAERSLKQIDS